MFDPLGAGVRVPAIAFALGVGMAMGRPLTGVLAAGGAFTVGFGAPLDLRGSSPLLLAVASVAIGASATVGSIAATQTGTAVAVAAVVGALCGAAAPLGPAVAWIALQCGLAATIATGFAASPERAAMRALAIMAGGLTQAAILSLAHETWRPAPSPPASPEPESPRYALHLAVGLAAALAVERGLGMRNGYWVPMTTLLVLRPGARHTMARAISRTIGTFGGAGIASAAIVGLHPGPGALGMLVGAAALGAYVFQKATYGLLSTFVTMYVVFLMALAGQPERDVAAARIVATAVGAAIGLAVQGVYALAF